MKNATRASRLGIVADGSMAARETSAARDIAGRSGQPVVCVSKIRCR